MPKATIEKIANIKIHFQPQLSPLEHLRGRLKPGLPLKYPQRTYNGPLNEAKSVL